MRRALLVPLLVAATHLAAQPVYLPAKAAFGIPPLTTATGESMTFPGTMPARTQQVWDVAEVPASIPVATWTSLQFRAPALLVVFSQSGNPAATETLSVTLAFAPQVFASPSPTFASNVGTLTTTVFSGSVSFPAMPVAPIAMAKPWSPTITFGAPFLFIAAAGKTFVVDIKSSGGGPGAWWLEQWPTASLGEYAANLPPQTGCKFGGGGYHYAVQLAGYPFPGQPWSFGYAGLPPGTPGVAALGTLGVGKTWNGAALPLDLALLGAPGCALAVSIDATLPLLADATGLAKLPSIPIPPSPQVDRGVFYDQGIFLDATANALGVVTGTSAFWRIGGPRSGTRVYASGPNAHTVPTGTIDLSSATTMRFN